MKLCDFVKVYDGVLPQQICDHLIDLYEMSDDITRHNDLMRFGEVNINQVIDKHVLGMIVNNQKMMLNKYKQDCGMTDVQFPDKYGFEEFRVKKYSAGGYFKDHVDVNDGHSCVRFISFLYYLNDSDGNTEFYFNDEEINIQPKAGRLVVFPPLWMFPHSGTSPSSNKYIMSSYTHYVKD